jgi:transposase
MAELDAIDRGEDGHGPGRGEALAAKIARVRERRQAQEAMLGQLTASGESQVSLTDPDARAMVTGQKTTVGYNAQVAVNAKHKLIVEQQVTNAATDMGPLADAAWAARETLDVERIDAVANMGYYKGEDIEACEASGITPMSPGPSEAARLPTAAFPRSASPTIRQPTPITAPVAAFRHPLPLGHARACIDPVFQPCRLCRLHHQGTLHRRPLGRINLWENEAVLERMARRLAARPGILNVRRETVEHPFGSIKQWMNQGAFLMRGLEKVRAEFSLTALAYNLRRAITIVCIPGMIQAPDMPPKKAFQRQYGRKHGLEPPLNRLDARSVRWRSAREFSHGPPSYSGRLRTAALSRTRRSSKPLWTADLSQTKSFHLTLSTVNERQEWITSIWSVSDRV